MRLRIEKRFWTQVRMASSGCLEWQGNRLAAGYGRIHLNGVMARAHRVAWQLCRGAIPEGLCVLHECDNPPCVNPVHLFLGTHADNAADRDRKGRQAKGERQGLAKLTCEKVKRIRQLLYAGHSQRSLGREFQVSNYVIFAIKHRKTWRWLQ